VSARPAHCVHCGSSSRRGTFENLYISPRAKRTLSHSPPLAVRFFEQFDYSGHTCLVFEHMSQNLYEQLRRVRFQGLALTLIRKLARQILKALAFLRLPEVDIIREW
jgi:hypothetical protein